MSACKFCGRELDHGFHNDEPWRLQEKNCEVYELRALRDRLVAWNRDAPLWHDRNQELAAIIATAEKLKE